MRFILIVAFLMACITTAFAEEEMELRRFLSLLTTARIGDDYDAVKKLVPEIEALHKDAGDNNTEALVHTRIGKIALRGEFNFSKGHLGSHGFVTGKLTHAQASDFLLRCVPVLEQLYGSSERHVSLSNDSEGDCPGGDSIGISFNWHKNRTLLGLDFHYRREFATVSWGAQAE